MRASSMRAAWAAVRDRLVRSEACGGTTIAPSGPVPVTCGRAARGAAGRGSAAHGCSVANGARGDGQK